MRRNETQSPSHLQVDGEELRGVITARHVVLVPDPAAEYGQGAQAEARGIVSARGEASGADANETRREASKADLRASSSSFLNVGTETSTKLVSCRCADGPASRSSSVYCQAGRGIGRGRGVAGREGAKASSERPP